MIWDIIRGPCSSELTQEQCVVPVCMSSLPLMCVSSCGAQWRTWRRRGGWAERGRRGTRLSPAAPDPSPLSVTTHQSYRPIAIVCHNTPVLQTHRHCLSQHTSLTDPSPLSVTTHQSYRPIAIVCHNTPVLQTHRHCLSQHTSLTDPSPLSVTTHQSYRPIATVCHNTPVLQTHCHCLSQHTSLTDPSPLSVTTHHSGRQSYRMTGH